MSHRHVADFLIQAKAVMAYDSENEVLSVANNAEWWYKRKALTCQG
jgi:hypothetical protein